VIIGRREEKEAGGTDLEGGEGSAGRGEEDGLLGEPIEGEEVELEEGRGKDEDVVQLGDLEDDGKSDDDELVDLRSR